MHPLINCWNRKARVSMLVSCMRHYNCVFFFFENWLVGGKAMKRVCFLFLLKRVEGLSWSLRPSMFEMANKFYRSNTTMAINSRVREKTHAQEHMKHLAFGIIIIIWIVVLNLDYFSYITLNKKYVESWSFGSLNGRLLPWYNYQMLLCSIESTKKVALLVPTCSCSELHSLTFQHHWPRRAEPRRHRWLPIGLLIVKTLLERQQGAGCLGNVTKFRGVECGAQKKFQSDRQHPDQFNCGHENFGGRRKWQALCRVHVSWWQMLLSVCHPVQSKQIGGIKSLAASCRSCRSQTWQTWA